MLAVIYGDIITYYSISRWMVDFRRKEVPIDRAPHDF